jgi:hypothetical protein
LVERSVEEWIGGIREAVPGGSDLDVLLVAAAAMGERHDEELGLLIGDDWLMPVASARWDLDKRLDDVVDEYLEIAESGQSGQFDPEMLRQLDLAITAAGARYQFSDA